MEQGGRAGQLYRGGHPGLKLFSSQGNELIHGYNVYNALEGMEYLHGTSFDAAREELEAFAALVRPFVPAVELRGV